MVVKTQWNPNSTVGRRQLARVAGGCGRNRSVAILKCLSGETAPRNDTPERDIVSDISKQQLRSLW